MMTSISSVSRTVLRFPSVSLPARAGDKLRGYFGNAFKDKSSLFHNHRAEGGYHYRYAQVQYKVLDGIPTVVAVKDAARLLLEAAHAVNELVIDDRTHVAVDKEISTGRVEFGVAAQLYRYRFISPYYALNQTNYRQFVDLAEDERPDFLDRMVRSHLIALHAGLSGGEAPTQTVMSTAKLRPVSVLRDGQKMMMFWGEVVTNMIVPPLLGVGKSASSGFGVLARM